MKNTLFEMNFALAVAIAFLSCSATRAEPAAPLPPQLCITNNAGKVLTVKRPSPTRRGRLVSNGVIYEFDYYGNITQVTPPPKPQPPPDVRAAQLQARIKRLKEMQKRAEEELKELKK